MNKTVDFSTIAKAIILEARSNYYPFGTVFENIVTGTLTSIDIEDSKRFVKMYPTYCPEYISIVANGNPENLVAVAEEALTNFLANMSE